MNSKIIQNLSIVAVAIFCLTAIMPNHTKADTLSTEAVIIAQPTDVIECEGSVDQFLFVVAAPLDRQYKIVYRWWKDGKPYSNWVEDFGQITFDTLDYEMSGTYRAEIFAFDPNWISAYGNPFSYDSARVSPKIFSERANLYVLQRPEFMHDIPSMFLNLGDDIVLTFEANIYGEHNMVDPTYWTEIRWYNDSIPMSDNFRYEGTSSSILAINDIQASDFGTKYRVRLIGNCDTVWSNYFALSQEPQASVTIQPFSTEGCIDDVVQFSVEAESSVSGIAIQYQWLVDGAVIMDEAGKFSGANTRDLNVTLNPALGYDGTEEYVCQVWPTGYPNNNAMSDPAIVTWKMAPTITTDLSSDYSVNEGDALEFIIVADGQGLTYTWTKDGADLGVDNDSLSLTDLKVDDAGEYVVTVSNECGEVSSTVATLEVTPGPVVTDVPLQERIGLHQNYPNPFSTNSTISWNSQSGGYATMLLLDMLGNEVATLYNANVGAGFNKVEINTNKLNLSAGAYYVTFRLNNIVETKQITIVK